MVIAETENGVQRRALDGAGRTERLTIALTDLEKQELVRRAGGKDGGLADFAGDLLVWAMQQKGYLPYWYERPAPAYPSAPDGGPLRG